jgi:vacuolar-type H+-ATPase subunit I/STV1
MSSDYDATEFIDGDYESRPSRSGAPSPNPVPAPTREEVDQKVSETQQKLAELKRAQEELERERAGLEETRRRQAEFQTGRQEIIQNLTRGLGLLEEAEFAARRDAEQLGRTLADFRDALGKVQALNEQTWTQANFKVELTRALTVLENARMEWNAARLKHPLLSGPAEAERPEPAAPQNAVSVFPSHSFGELCRLGFALTWPVALAVLLSVAALAAILLRR